MVSSDDGVELIQSIVSTPSARRLASRRAKRSALEPTFRRSEETPFVATSTRVRSASPQRFGDQALVVAGLDVVTTYALDVSSSVAPASSAA
jgi:hypothetical protein